jgi:16S rRNA (uracil1498-N3)-methyltransferase
VKGNLPQPQKFSRLQRLAIAPDQRQQQQIDLTPEQRHYLTRVLRLRTGDRFLVLESPSDSLRDGSERWLAELESEGARLLELAPALTELSTAVTLLAALPKGSGFEQVIQQATELGVTQILPLISDRTLLQPSPQKVERWRRIIQEAAEQSQRQQVPILSDPVTFEQGIATTQGWLCVTDPEADHLWNCLAGEIGTEVAIATGPEGGWTEAEVLAALAAGWQPVSLGQRILRAVTAPIVGLSLIAARLELAKHQPQENPEHDPTGG